MVGSVGHVVPTGFDAYARVLHPVEDFTRDEQTTWAQVAAETGRTVHPLVQWHRLVGSEDYLKARGADWNLGRPDRGTLQPAALSALLRVLGRHTTAPEDCWFCVWEGYGLVNPQPGSRATVSAGPVSEPPPATAPASLPAELVAGARVTFLPRDYLLLHGPVASALLLGEQVTPDWFIPQSPNLFWPADRAWCVGSEIDFDSTLVAGSATLIDELLDATDLEVWPVRPEDSLTYDADRIN
jgi:hypothetical protein